MENIQKTNGKRYILVGKCIWAKKLVQIIEQEFGKYGYSFPKTELGKCLMLFASLIDKQVKELVPLVGRNFQ